MYDWAAFNTIIQAAHSQFVSAVEDLHFAASYLGIAGTDIGNQDWAAAKSDLTSAKNYLNNAANHFFIDTNSGFFKLRQVHNYINDAWLDGFGMLELIASMSKATPDELMTFICLEDAYRAALWDRPYNPEYFATMVRAFKSWA
jgi:hypothetical protein